MPARSRVDQDLRVLDSARGTDVSALDADRASACLQIAGLVDHQHRLVVAHGSVHENGFWLSFRAE
ncbi:hypothetical protein ADK75_08225 [Streptomyces virginiae]|uniref:Uncharacterized protein n=1 Tax=Streptomyces virginiae TaxID=1961 RepID=A0A0L8N0H2_STRVG|nr:hypothetical protein ADK75_08225 [Streptomyces virginiae]